MAMGQRFAARRIGHDDGNQDLSQVLSPRAFRYALLRAIRRRSDGMIDFKGSQFEKAIILWGVRWYVAYPISYRQLEEMMGERGVAIDHSTLNRWVIKRRRNLRKCSVAVSVPWAGAGGLTRPRGKSKGTRPTYTVPSIKTAIRLTFS